MTFRGLSIASIRNSSTKPSPGATPSSGTDSVPSISALKVSRTAELQNPSGLFSYGIPKRLAFVAQAAGATVRKLFTMPEAPSTIAPAAVAGLDGLSPTTILATISGGVDGTSLLVAFESADARDPTGLRLLQGTSACHVQLTANVSSVQAATLAHGSLYLVAAVHAAPGVFRLWQIPQTAMAAGLCGAPVPITPVGAAFVLRSRLSLCGNSLAFVAATDSDDTARLWSIEADGTVTSRQFGDNRTVDQIHTLPGIACMGQSVSAVAMSSGNVALMSVAGGVVVIVSPAPQAQFASPRALTAVGDRFCFLGDVVAVFPTVKHSALFCWTQGSGVVRVQGATVPASVNWLMPSSPSRLYMPCVLSGSAVDAQPRACVYDFARSNWIAVVDEDTGAPVYQTYSSFSAAGGTTFFAGKLAGGGGSMTLWHLV